MAGCYFIYGFANIALLWFLSKSFTWPLDMQYTVDNQIRNCIHMYAFNCHSLMAFKLYSVTPPLISYWSKRAVTIFIHTYTRSSPSAVYQQINHRCETGGRHSRDHNNLARTCGMCGLWVNSRQSDLVLVIGPWWSHLARTHRWWLRPRTGRSRHSLFLPTMLLVVTWKTAELS